MSNYDSLGNRMKGYESATKRLLIRRMPVIIRLDGRAFHTFTKNIKNPFDVEMHELMVGSTIELVKTIQNAVFGFTQSDEISILLNDWTTHESEQWFGGCQNKIESVSASMVTAVFNNIRHSRGLLPQVSYPYATFDSRTFNIPKEDVCNLFVWRQNDASRNSIQMLGRMFFSHKEMQGKNNSEIQDMLMNSHGVNWNDLDVWKRRGCCVYKDVDVMVVDEQIPIFSQDRQFIERFL